MSWLSLMRSKGKNKIQEGLAEVYANGFLHGARAERERIIKELLNDAVISTNLDTDQVERIVEIVEG